MPDFNLNTLDDEPAVDVCRDCTTPATCSLYEKCMRTDEFLDFVEEER